MQRWIYRYKIHHLFFWLLVFAIWFYLRYEDYTVPGMAFKVTFIKVLDLALMVYVTNYIFIPLLFYRKKYVSFALCFIALISLSSLLKMNILGRLMNAPQYYDLGDNLKTRIYDNFIPHFFLVIAGAAIKLMIDYTRLQRRMVETAREKAEAELNFLRSQINPHFLFNSLNAVFFQIDKSNTEARNSLHKFSEMLRYQRTEATGDKLPIQREIAYLKDYVDMQKLRKDEHYEIRFDQGQDLSGFSIEPLILISFVENAFKHISHHTNSPNYINIQLSKTGTDFNFLVENSKSSEASTELSGGIGLKNVKRRLELLYPGKHESTLKDDGGIYQVKLKMVVD